MQGEYDPKGSAKDHIRPLKAKDLGPFAFLVRKPILSSVNRLRGGEEGCLPFAEC